MIEVTVYSKICVYLYYLIIITEMERKKTRKKPLTPPSITKRSSSNRFKTLNPKKKFFLYFVDAKYKQQQVKYNYLTKICRLMRRKHDDVRLIFFRVLQPSLSFVRSFSFGICFQQSIERVRTAA